MRGIDIREQAVRTYINGRVVQEGALAEMTFDVERWSDAAANRATLTRFVRPRDLDPALGPGPE